MYMYWNLDATWIWMRCWLLNMKGKTSVKIKQNRMGFSHYVLQSSFISKIIWQNSAGVSSALCSMRCLPWQTVVQYTWSFLWNKSKSSEEQSKDHSMPSTHGSNLNSLSSSTEHSYITNQLVLGTSPLCTRHISHIKYVIEL